MLATYLMARLHGNGMGSMRKIVRLAIRGMAGIWLLNLATLQNIRLLAIAGHGSNH